MKFTSIFFTASAEILGVHSKYRYFNPITTKEQIISANFSLIENKIVTLYFERKKREDKKEWSLRQ